jgi:deoxyribonuclease V
VEIQRRLRQLVEVDDWAGQVRLFAGVDVAYPKGCGMAQAGVAVCDGTTLELVESRAVSRPLKFPYIPGLLSFREAPVILDALEEVGVPIDVLLVDGHGLAHPRRFGLACHLGVLTGLPTIGVGKKLLTGIHGPVGETRGEWSPLEDGGETVGVALRTRSGVKPVFVSVGHRVTLESAIRLVLRCSPRYRIPEPIRSADRRSRTRM